MEKIIKINAYFDLVESLILEAPYENKRNAIPFIIFSI